MFKVSIAGTQTFEDYSLLKERCDYYLQNHDEIEIISEGARGADFLEERYAVDSGYKLSKFVAD
ncbi:SLOG family protein [Chryseobacterium indologenes]|uniref:SLOG family protein n=1 Tax=Chryseobacterium indologenes TaxID=253 RepID=UPI00076E377F|nr:SLOG family protein [Chryseobacterium indologenes]